jgi:cell wall-associated NlpC family hydrolase
MGRLRRCLPLAFTALASLVPAQAAAATPPSDIPASFFARTQIAWTVNQGWMTLRADGTFSPKRAASRLAAARILAYVNESVHGEPVADDPFAQAVAARWIAEGDGASGTITQLEFDRGIVNVLRQKGAARAMNRIATADGWRPRLPNGFGAEQVVRQIGARWNVPNGADEWETWPGSTLRRANLAVQAYQLGHLSSWWQTAVSTQLNVVNALPKYPPLKQAVLGFAIRYAGAPYVWGGTSDAPQNLFGLPTAGGFDCSGFVWWVMKLRTYTVDGTTWSGDSKIAWRTTYDMAANLPVSKRLPYSKLKPGDVLFWSTNSNGVRTASSTVYHTGIYLGNGWTINSHGSGAGVTIDYMAPGAGWFHDAFAFGWRVMPVGV